MNHWQTKTAEERKAIAQRGVKTRQRNIKKAKRYEFILKSKLTALLDEVQKLEEKRNVLANVCSLSNKAIQVCGKTLATKEEIITHASLWEQPCGVYFLIQNNKIVYIGQSTNIYSRIPAHTDKKFETVAYVPCPEKALDLLESLYIHTFKPPLNGTQTNGVKMSPLPFDKVITMLTEENSNAL